MKSLQMGLGVLFAVLVASGSAAAAPCSNTSLTGVFGFQNAGFDSPGVPGTSVGQYSFDGAGNVSGSFTHSDNGTITNLTFTGTYAVAKNCTGSMTLNNSNGITEHSNFVIDDARKGLQLIRTDSGQIKSGFALAQGAVTCGLTGIKQTFAFNVSGTDSPQGAIAAVGQLTLDGNGTITGGIITLSVNGSVGTFPLSGTYTESANCTGTQVVMPSGLSPSNFNFVVVNGGKEVLLIETDASSTVSGNAQQ